MERNDAEIAFEESREMDASPAERAERARRAGDPYEAARIARELLGHGDDSAVRAALALALLDLGELDEARHALEMLLESLTGEESGLHGNLSFGVSSAHTDTLPDDTLAAATAATLELVGALDDGSFERALETAEVQRELMLDADGVAEQVLRDIPAEIPDEILPSIDSPFATRTFADLLERQGHESEAETLRSRLSRRLESAQSAPEASVLETAAGGRAHVVATLERWLENLRRTAA
jgi:hypothetical protein